jgi:arsenical pump membrane protein
VLAGQLRLLTSVYIAGVLVTAVLSNDATALLLTPVAFAVSTRLGLDPRPYAFACALVANAASFVLPVSHSANLLVLSPHLDLDQTRRPARRGVG